MVIFIWFYPAASGGGGNPSNPGGTGWGGGLITIPE